MSADAVEAARRVRETVEFLANTPMQLSLIDWNTHSNVLLRAADLLSRVEEWKPIETVPKNHFPLLAWSLETGRVVAFRDVAWNWWPCPALEPLPYPPTHWQPLPSLPSL